MLIVTFKNALKRCLEVLGFTPKEKIVAYKNGIKTDIFIKIDDKEVGVSIKSSTKTSFHQLNRRRLEEWKSFLNMPEDIFRILRGAVLRVSRNSRDKFILESDRDKIRSFFAKHLKAVIDEIFRRGERNLNIFMVNNKRKRKIYVFNMDDVLFI